MSTLERIGVRRVAAASRAAAVLLLVGVGAGVVFGVPSPTGGVAPLADPEPTIVAEAETMDEPEQAAAIPVDFEFLGYALATTEGAPEPPEEPVADAENEPEPAESDLRAGAADIQYVGGLRGGSLTLAVLRIDGQERVVRAGQTVQGVELLAADAASARVRVDGQERTIEAAERSGAAVSAAPGAGGGGNRGGSLEDRGFVPRRNAIDPASRAQELERRRQQEAARSPRSRAQGGRD